MLVTLTLNHQPKTLFTRAVVLNQGDFVPHLTSGPFGNGQRHFWSSSVERRSAMGIQWVEARVAATFSSAQDSPLQ
jgi:hypothetical protein